LSTAARAQTAQSDKTSSSDKTDHTWVFAGPTDRKWIGITAVDYNPEKAKQDQNGGTRRGVMVRNVVGNTPAERAGLKKGDVIVEIDGQPVESIRALREKLQQIDFGKQVSMSIVRDGAPQQLNITLEKGPEKAFYFNFPHNGVRVYGLQNHERSLERARRATERAQERAKRAQERGQEAEKRALERAQTAIEAGKDWEGFGEGFGDYFVLHRGRLGVNTQGLTEQLGDFFGVEKGRGVLITSVRENSAAAKAGIKAGDVIVEINGIAVSSSSQLRRELAKIDSGEVRLTVIRNRQRIELRPILEPRPASAMLAPYAGLGQVYSMPAMPNFPVMPEMPAMPSVPAIPALPELMPDFSFPNIEIPEFEPCDFDITEFI
jgi:C-terminal processing protease CtpA/Prc